MPTIGEVRNDPASSAKALNAVPEVPKRATRGRFIFRKPKKTASDQAVGQIPPQAPIVWDAVGPLASVGMVSVSGATRISAFDLGYSLVAKVELRSDGYVVSSGDLGESRGVSLNEAYTHFLTFRYQRSEEALHRSYQRMDEIRSLPPGWDAYQARSISETALSTAKSLLSNLRDSDYVLGEKIEPYAIVPLSTGGVQLEWQGSRGSLEIQAEPDGSLGYLQEIRSVGLLMPQTVKEGQVTSEAVLALLKHIL